MANQDEEVVSLLSSQDKSHIDEEESIGEIQQVSQRGPVKARCCEDSDKVKHSCRFGGKFCLWCLMVALLLVVLFDASQHAQLPPWVQRKYPLPQGTRPKNFTFPSVDERVRYYMSNWYNIPHDYTAGLNRSSSLCNDIKLCKPDSICEHNVPWIWSEDSLSKLRKDSYATDSLLLFKFLETEQQETEPRIAITYGDFLLQNPVHPVFAKSRFTPDAQPHRPVTSQTIITYLHAHRHYSRVPDAVNFFTWQEKNDTLIFRGANTGQGERIPTIEKYNQIGEHSLQDVDIALTWKPTSHLQKNDYSFDKTKYRPLFRDYKTQYQLLQYKYLLVMEGNDVSSGLKWMLFSNSVVFMAKPTKVSWAMEDLLVPFVHYVPVKDDYSDLLEMVEWARAHDEECELISQQATQYIYDLHMSPQAAKDREEILSRMMQRYQTNYCPILSKC